MLTRRAVNFVTHSLADAAFLFYGTAVMSNRPRQVVKIINVDKERPGDPISSKVQKARTELWTLFKNFG